MRHFRRLCTQTTSACSALSGCYTKYRERLLAARSPMILRSVVLSPLLLSFEKAASRARTHQNVPYVICAARFLKLPCCDFTAPRTTATGVHASSVRAPGGTGDVKDLVKIEFENRRQRWESIAFWALHLRHVNNDTHGRSQA